MALTQSVASTGRELTSYRGSQVKASRVARRRLDYNSSASWSVMARYKTSRCCCSASQRTCCANLDTSITRLGTSTIRRDQMVGRLLFVTSRLNIKHSPLCIRESVTNEDKA